MSSKPERRPQTATVMATRLAGVPLIDWSLVDQDEDGQVWEGRSSMHQDRLYRVEALRQSRGGVRLSGLQRVNSLRRLVPDQDVADLGDREATAFFDQMVAIATRR
jgi:hypothetical protein